MSSEPGPDQSIQMLWPPQREFLESEAHITALFSGAGLGKCLNKHTKVLTYSGEVVAAHEVRVGDLLMGPDSKPRRVLEVHTGKEPLCRIRPVKGDAFEVTINHQLTLSRSYGKRSNERKGDLLDVTVAEWLTWTPTQKKFWKLVRSGVDFQSTGSPGPIDPYFMGILLGDGSVRVTPNVTTMDDVIVQEVYRQADKYGLNVTVIQKSPEQKASTYALSRKSTGENPLTRDIREIGVWGHTSGTKRIPLGYKVASRNDRLALLAGLMDTDGSYTQGSGVYDYVSKSKQLADDVAFVARSLGLAAYVKPCRKGCQTGAVGTYYRVQLSGDIDQIPARLRPAEVRKQIKDVLHTGFSVEFIEEPQEWVGFTLDGDHRFLLGDFTITHNSIALTERIVKDHSRHDNWWEGRPEFNTNPLILMVGAAHEAYLAENTVPLFRAALDRAESRIGRKLRKRTGRNRDGWFGSIGHRHQEMLNATDIHFKSFPTKENAVAVTVAGLYFDEVTMLSDVEIWRRSLQRVRDPRAGKRPSGKPWNFVACVGTPEEDHFIHEALFDPMTGDPYPGINVIMGSSIENPLLPDSWFIDAGRHSSTLFTRMQVMGEWVRGAGGQRFSHVFNEDKHVVHLKAPPNGAGLKFDLGWDPGYRTGSVVIMWQHPKTGAWYVVDEIVIQNKTTNDVCTELLSLGYNAGNIRSICMDPRDNKKRSSSEVTDGETVYRRFGIRPKNKHIGERSGELHVRLDALEDLLKTDKFFINDKILPKNREQLGLVNALHRFATKKMAGAPEQFTDAPTRDTTERWKHPIDAVHFVLMHHERGVYARVSRNPGRNQVTQVRSGA